MILLTGFLIKHGIKIGIVAGLAILAYTHRAYAKAFAAKELAKAEGVAKTELTKLRVGISLVIADAKKEASKAETTAAGIITKIEADIRAKL